MAGIHALDALIGQAEQSPEHTYTFLFCDLLTDAVLAELPLQDVSYGYELNGIGAMRAFVPLNNETFPLDPINATTGGRTAVYVDRDGSILWGGIVWTRDPAKGGMQIQAAEFLSYYQHRYITQTLSTLLENVTANPALVPDGRRLYSDQKSLLWSLFRWSSIAAGGGIRIDINPLAGTGHGVSRVATYFGYERQELFALMKQLASADDGFDFGIEVGWNPVVNNVPPSRFRKAVSWYPRRGRPAADSGLVFSKGGPAANIVAYNWPEDFTAVADQVWAVGDGDGEARLIAGAADLDMLAAGWPLLESVQRYEGVTELATLQGHANADVNARSVADVAPWFDVLADGDPALGGYSVGDEATFTISDDPRFPDGLEAQLRIVSMDVNASKRPEIVRLTCVGV